MGAVLALVSKGQVMGLNAFPQASLSLYLLSSACLFLFASYANVYSEAMAEMRKYRDTRNFGILLLEYCRCFAVLAGGVLVLSALVILFS